MKQYTVSFLKPTFFKGHEDFILVTYRSGLDNIYDAFDFAVKMGADPEKDIWYKWEE